MTMPAPESTESALHKPARVEMVRQPICDQIEWGMTPAAVQALLGRTPDEIGTAPFQMSLANVKKARVALPRWTWKGERGRIEVTFSIAPKHRNTVLDAIFKPTDRYAVIATLQ